MTDWVGGGRLGDITARSIRVVYANAVYHVTARGNERKAIYRDDADRRRFLETVEQMVEQFGVVIHAFCLMPNHDHFLLQTPRANLNAAAVSVLHDHRWLAALGVAKRDLHQAIAVILLVL